MRFVVFGAGGIGGTVGGRLVRQGHDVVLIARGEHLHAIQRDGLRLRTPEGDFSLPIPAVGHPSQVEWKDGDVVLLTMKTQDTLPALDALAACAPSAIPVVCVQNGVANERMALRRFPRVYGAAIWCATGFLQPGTVESYGSPIPGILDVGCYPSDVDDVAREVTAAARSAAFDAQARSDVMRWKYRKLISNLGNAIDALCGPAARGSSLVDAARREGLACLAAAGIDWVRDEEGLARERQTMQLKPIGDQKRPGGSTWQSLARGAHAVECDYLNGEIVLLGRLHGVPTPVNAMLQRESRSAAERGAAPGSVPIENLETLVSKL